MLPSVQVVPLGTARWTHPVTGSQESTVQTFRSSQFRGAPGTQVPVALQSSFPLQRLPSGQGVFAGKFVKTQPDAGLQESDVQGFESLQTSGVPERHTPAPLQVSVPLQTLASVQKEPAGVGGNWHPSTGSH